MFLFEHAHAPSQSDWTKREINFNSRPINKLIELLQPFGVDLEMSIFDIKITKNYMI